MIKSFRNFVYVNKLIFNNFSILRVLQILEFRKLSFQGNILDVGGKRSSNNISNYILSKNVIVYLDKFSENEKTN